MSKGMTKDDLFVENARLQDVVFDKDTEIGALKRELKEAREEAEKALISKEHLQRENSVLCSQNLEIRKACFALLAVKYSPEELEAIKRELVPEWISERERCGRVEFLRR